MKIKLLVGRSGTGGSFSPGEEVTVGDAEGLRMIKAGQGIPVEPRKENTSKKNQREKRA